MKRNLIVAAIFLLVYICIGINTPANAAGVSSIPINNPGFEDPVMTENEYTFEVPPGWTEYNPYGLVPAKRTIWTSNIGVGNPGSNYYFDEAPKGENVGIVYLAQKPGSGIAGLEQKLDAVLKPNTKYTLTANVGNIGGKFLDISLDGFPGYRVELLAGNTVLAADDNSLSIEEGRFKTSMVTYTATPDCPYLGQKLGIRLINLLQEQIASIDFDDVSLTAEPA